MKPTPKRLPTALIWAARLVLLVLSALPIVLYLLTFGLDLSNTHPRWGEFGSLLGGIYSPLLAFLALAVLINQVRSQDKASTYQIDHSYIEQNRADIEFYLQRLDAALEENHESGTSLREYLQQVYCHLSMDELKSQVASEVAKRILKRHQKLFDLWGAIYPILIGLEAGGRFPYLHNATSAKQKVVVLLSHATCAALDNLHYCATQGKGSVKYAFSKEAQALSES